MFEPIHGSAPKYAGKNVLNPIGQILAGKMMLDWLGEKFNDEKARVAAERIERAVECVVAEGKVVTSDIGGKSKTREVGDAIAKKIREESQVPEHL
jgi:isocitrate/isopropylmalate dehydrogenase